MSLGFAFYRGADGVMLVADLTAPASSLAKQLDKWRDEFLEHAVSLPSLSYPEPYPATIRGSKWARYSHGCSGQQSRFDKPGGEQTHTRRRTNRGLEFCS